MDWKSEMYLHDYSVSALADVRQVRVARPDLEDLSSDDLSVGICRRHLLDIFSHAYAGVVLVLDTRLTTRDYF